MASKGRFTGAHECCNSLENHFHLLERYPELLFLLSYTPYTPSEPHTGNIEEEIERFQTKLRLDGVDILYIYGIGLGHHYAALKHWLKEKRERRIIFLEDDLGSVAALLHSHHAEELLYDGQVVVHFIANPKEIHHHLEELSCSYSCDRIEVKAIESYQTKEKEKIPTNSAKIAPAFHRASRHFRPKRFTPIECLPIFCATSGVGQAHFSRAASRENSATFPPIICGAGPSLQSSLPHLKDITLRPRIDHRWRIDNCRLEQSRNPAPPWNRY